MEGKAEFGWLNYSSFLTVLGVSVLIGIYHGFVKRNNTVQEYLLGGRSLGMLPITASLIVSFVSSTTIMGYPAEVYSHGTQILAHTIGYALAAPVHAFVFLPVFYRLQLTSVFQYTEMRFNSSLRKLVSLFYAIAVIMKTSVILYGVSLALSQVTRMNSHFAASLLAGVCLFYTILGGLKAVVWADTVQGIMMISAIVFFATVGTITEGGVSAVWKAAEEGDRIQFFNLDPDPTVRQSFWTVVIGHFFVISGFGACPAVIQRYNAIKTMRQAQWSVFLFFLGTELFNLLCGLLGLVIYARYRSCDPLTSGIIDNSDEIFPYYITEFGGRFKGLPGIVIAGVVCAVLSSISTMINAVSGTIYKDFIEPWFGDKGDRLGQNIVKILGTAVGLTSLLIVLALDKLGSIIELGMTTGEVSYGAMLGIYVLGIFFPSVDSVDVTIGSVTSLVTMSWLVIRSRIALRDGEIVYEKKPLSVEGCLFNVTINQREVLPANTSDSFQLYKISMFYYCGIGCLLTVITALTTCVIRRKEPDQVDLKLLSPLVHRFARPYVLVPPTDIIIKEGVTAENES